MNGCTVVPGRRRRQPPGELRDRFSLIVLASRALRDAGGDPAAAVLTVREVLDNDPDARALAAEDAVAAAVSMIDAITDWTKQS